MLDLNTNHRLLYISILTICLTIILSVFFLSRTPLYINNIGNKTDKNGTLSNTIPVTGKGKVYITPDMLSFSISVDEKDKTTAAVQSKVNTKIQAIKVILNKYSINQNDIQTSSLSINPEYDYVNDNNKVIGQEASQSLDIKLRTLGNNNSNANKLIDDLSSINNISLGSITFELQNKSDALNKARSLAFGDAKAKAVELAKLGDVTLLKPVTIEEKDITPDPIVFNTNKQLGAVDSSPSTSTSLSAGQLEMEIDLNVTFGIQ